MPGPELGEDKYFNEQPDFVRAGFLSLLGDDMTVRNLSPATQRSYLHAVAKFSRLAKAVAHRAKKRSLVPPHPAR